MTIRVTARLMPEVERVTVSIKMEKISWYSPMPAAPISWERKEAVAHVRHAQQQGKPPSARHLG